LPIAAEAIKEATSTYYGTAGPEFCRQLIERKITADWLVGASAAVYLATPSARRCC
jgi:hypothetical protein